MPAPLKAALYVRVSTTGQTVENQIRQLRAVARRHGWQVAGVFKDEAISGAKGREKRPGLDKLLEAVMRRDVDLVAAWSVDRLGRSLQDLLTVLGEIHAKGCDLYLHQQGIDTRTPSGKALFQMMGVFAEFERAMMVERVKSGLARAREQGKQLGRPRNDDPAGIAEVKRLRRQGLGINKIARKMGVGSSYVQRILTAFKRDERRQT
jgi:DNA invertase Pin-like site-specific DNA recombinase